MSRAILRGKWIKENALSIRGKVKQMWMLVSSWIWSSETWWERHSISLGGRIGGQWLLPLSNMMMLSSISLEDSFSWSGGTTTSRRRHCCLLNFFNAWQLRQWRTIVETSPLVWMTATHCVRRDELPILVARRGPKKDNQWRCGTMGAIVIHDGYCFLD